MTFTLCTFTVAKCIARMMVMRSESLRGKCAKLHTVAASNNRDQPTRSLYYCMFVPHLCGCCFSYTSRLWWMKHLTQHQWKGYNNISFLQWTTLFARSFCEGYTWHDLHILVTAPFWCDWKARVARVRKASHCSSKQQ